MKISEFIVCALLAIWFAMSFCCALGIVSYTTLIICAVIFAIIASPFVRHIYKKGE